MRVLLRFFGFLFAAGTILFLVGVGAARRPALAFLQGPARLFAIAGLRAAGDDPRARRRRLAGRRIRHAAPPLHPDPGRAEDGDQRLPRGRGQELLRAQRPRLRRHHPRRAALRAEPTAPAAGRRAPPPSPSRSPRTSCSPTRSRSSARSRRRCSRSRSSAPTRRRRSSSSISTKSISASAPMASPRRRCSISTSRCMN